MHDVKFVVGVARFALVLLLIPASSRAQLQSQATALTRFEEILTEPTNALLRFENLTVELDEFRRPAGEHLPIEVAICDGHDHVITTTTGKSSSTDGLTTPNASLNCTAEMQAQSFRLTSRPNSDKVVHRGFESSGVRLPQFWWKRYLTSTILGRETVPISSNSLALATLEHSPQIKVISARPQAAKTAIIEEAARFDWTAFVESRWRDTSEPTGSTLTTGAANIFRDHQLTNEAGLRKANRWGGQLSVGQQFGLQRTNSRFFSPPDQGSSTLAIDYSQPLLRGAGRSVNESTIVLAKLASDSADMNFVAQTQDLLAEVNQNYWELYFSRARLLIERRLYNRAVTTIDVLRKRERVDASKEMISRAQSSLALRKTRLIEARRQLLDQQSVLRNLVNSPELDAPTSREFLPIDPIRRHDVQISVEEAFGTAMTHRPEVARAIRDIRAASVRYHVSENELLPELNLALQTYAKGLRGNYDVSNAFDDMFKVS